MTFVRLRLIGAVVGSAAVAAAGCGGGGDAQPAPTDTLAKAAAATTKLGGHEARLDVRFDFRAGPTFDISAYGEVDPRRRRATYTVDMSDFAGPGSPLGTDPNKLIGETIERGPVAYVKLGTLTDQFRQLGVDATWFKLDTSKAVNARTKELREAVGNSYQNPGQVLDYLDAARQHVERLGEATVKGVPTIHYHAVMRLRRLGAGQPAVVRRGLQATAEKIRAFTGDDSVPVEAWIDRRGVVRRAKLAYRLVKNPETGRPIEGTAEAVFELSDFGVPVVAEPPPEDDVISAQELVRLAE